jgi:hypothetical protein
VTVGPEVRPGAGLLHPRSVQPHGYHRLSLAEKQALAYDRVREPAVVCPACGTTTTSSDLLQHVATRCPGPPQEEKHWRWVDWRQARSLGVPATTLSFWARTGAVRYRGERMDRQYLLRDLVMKIAPRRGFRRR